VSIERNSDTWRTVESWITGRLEKYRKQLESTDRTELQYAQLRGHIIELRALLDLAKPTKEHQE
jgi:hypothetical protein